MYYEKVQDQEFSINWIQHKLGILVKTSHPEPPEALYYWEKKKKSQISDLKFYKIYVCKEDQHAKPYQKTWIYQVLRVRQLS